MSAFHFSAVVVIVAVIVVVFVALVAVDAVRLFSVKYGLLRMLILCNSCQAETNNGCFSVINGSFLKIQNQIRLL